MGYLFVECFVERGRVSLFGSCEALLPTEARFRFCVRGQSKEGFLDAFLLLYNHVFTPSFSYVHHDPDPFFVPPQEGARLLEALLVFPPPPLNSKSHSLDFLWNGEFPDLRVGVCAHGQAILEVFPQGVAFCPPLTLTVSLSITKSTMKRFF